MHWAPVPHVMPQPPQLLVVVPSVQTPPQTMSPAGQHMLSTQIRVPEHDLPQAPQADAELVRSKQPGVPESSPHCTRCPPSAPASVSHV